MPETVIPYSAPTFISYARLQKNLRQHALLMTELPVENRLSLPLPTRRFAGGGAACAAAYAFYSAPAYTPPGQPKTEGLPNFWGAMEARGGGLLLFTRCALIPFATPEQAAAWANVSAPSGPNAGQTPESVEDALTSFARQLETLAPLFFRGAAGGRNMRRDALRDFKAAVPVALHDRYRALAPDFLAWLGMA